MFNGSKNERHEMLENLQQLKRSEILATGWKEMRDVAKGWIIKGLQYQAVGN